ncbi:hypothetical protein NDU88_006386 [Pleurodeles waltl]|uniref:Uncharacterized protein n=1 Tax=Pleurodeles waltl TaxID=8319 RepID=A0AAV7VPJ6_PLEWA|nr:hypothetical protein NDU88_006386 [Pleurodeles waltl]
MGSGLRPRASRNSLAKFWVTVLNLEYQTGYNNIFAQRLGAQDPSRAFYQEQKGVAPQPSKNGMSPCIYSRGGLHAFLVRAGVYRCKDNRSSSCFYNSFLSGFLD